MTNETTTFLLEIHFDPWSVEFSSQEVQMVGAPEHVLHVLSHAKHVPISLF